MKSIDPKWTRYHELSHPIKLLEYLKIEIDSAAHEGQRLLAIFDIDSTLLSVSPRIQKILNEFRSSPIMQETYPYECRVLMTVEHHPSEWGIRPTLERAGLSLSSAQFYIDIIQFWKDHFFDDIFLHIDEPYEGAVEFVTELHQAGAHICYLTGRHQKTMQLGTVESLRRWQFPFEMNRTELYLKPDKDLDDTIYKPSMVAKMNPQAGPIWVFENEPINLQAIQQQNPHIHPVYFESIHSGKAPPQSHWCKISSFQLR